VKLPDRLKFILKIFKMNLDPYNSSIKMPSKEPPTIEIMESQDLMIHTLFQDPSTTKIQFLTMIQFKTPIISTKKDNPIFSLFLSNIKKIYLPPHKIKESRK